MKGFLAALAVAFAVHAAAVGLHPQGAAAKDSLYQRLGGYDALVAVTDDLLQRLDNDASLGRFLVGHSTNSLQRIKQDIVDFLCHATGGPCVYRGRDMKTAHAGMGITAADWDQMVVHLTDTLSKLQVPPAERDEVLAAVSGLRKDIVEQ